MRQVLIVLNKFINHLLNLCLLGFKSKLQGRYDYYCLSRLVKWLWSSSKLRRVEERYQCCLDFEKFDFFITPAHRIYNQILQSSVTQEENSWHTLQITWSIIKSVSFRSTRNPTSNNLCSLTQRTQICSLFLQSAFTKSKITKNHETDKARHIHTFRQIHTTRQASLKTQTVISSQRFLRGHRCFTYPRWWR